MDNENFWKGFEKQAGIGSTLSGLASKAGKKLAPVADKAKYWSRRAAVATGPAKRKAMKVTQRPAAAVSKGGTSLLQKGRDMASKGGKALHPSSPKIGPKAAPLGLAGKTKAYGQRYGGQALGRTGRFVQNNPRSAAGLAALGTAAVGGGTYKAVKKNPKQAQMQ